MRKRKIITGLLTILMMLPIFIGMGGMKTVMAATDDQMVTLHKLKYDTQPDTIQNNGDVMPDFTGTALPDATFTTYDVTTTYWEAYDKTTGSDAVRTSAGETAVWKLVTDKTLPAGVVFGTTGSDGTISKALETKKEGRNAIYLFVETDFPAGVVESMSDSFILGLPIYDGTDDSKLKDIVHVYPKNVVKAADMSFTKYGVEGNKAPVELPGATFVLKNEAGEYYDGKGGFTTTAPTTVADGLFISDAEGLVSLQGVLLPKGNYYFHETNSTVSKDTGATGIYHYDATKNPVVTAHVDGEMGVTYDYYENGIGELLENQASAKAYNFKVSKPEKTVDGEDVDISTPKTFTISQQIDKDIKNYTAFKLVDNFGPHLELVNNNKDDLLTEIKASITDPVIAALIESVDIDTTNNTFTVNFLLDEVKKHALETITFTVDMMVKSTAPLDQAINNKITLETNWGPESGNATVKTYGKSFVKVDGDNTENKLDDAYFYVKKGNSYLGMRKGKLAWEPTSSGVIKSDGRYTFADGFTPKELVSGSDGKGTGKFSVKGLAKTDNKGNEITYQLVEFSAPKGYALRKTPFNFVVDDGSEKWAKPVVNAHKGSLPSTGGSGIVAFVLIGVVAVGGAVLYFTKGRRQIEG